MTAPGRNGRTMPNLMIRALVMLLAAALVSIVAVGGVQAVTRPEAAVTVTGDRTGAGGEEEAGGPDLGRGLGELGIQVVLLVGIAFAGRRVLKIRL